MISELKIGNFKAFGPAQAIPLRPITLVFGPNSAGKSSVIQSLLLARHIHDTGKADAHQTTLGGAAVDLGGFTKYAHGHHSDRETTIRLTFSRADIPGKFEETGEFKSFGIEYAIGTLPGNGASNTAAAAGITSATLFIDERPRRFIQIEDGTLRVDVDAMRSRLEERRKSLEADQDFGPLVIADFLAVIAELAEAKFSIERLKLRALNPLPRTAFYTTDDLHPEEHRADGNPNEFFAVVSKLGEDELDYANAIWRWHEMDRLSSEERDAEQNPKETPQSRAKVFRFHLECLIDAANEAIAAVLANLSYLGPLRWIPPRVIPDGEQFDASWAAGGGDAWLRLRHEPELLHRVNRFLQETLHSRYRLRCQHLAPELDAEAIALCVKRALESNAATSTESCVNDPNTARVAEDPPPSVRAKAGASDLAAALQSELRAQTYGEGLTELSLVDAESGLAVSHRDVGTGISQLLPVLVNAAGGKNQLIAIEQPELHLHPALQAELGDVFIESALGENKNTFLIETHSEHLILRLLRRIRESNAHRQPAGSPQVRPEDVAILFVQPTESGAIVKHLRVDERGRLIDPWPGGFFEESFNELF